MSKTRALAPDEVSGRPDLDLWRQVSHGLVAVAVNQQALGEEFAPRRDRRSTSTDAPVRGRCAIDLSTIARSGWCTSGRIPRSVQYQTRLNTLYGRARNGR
jgi:hypothetical protein